MVFLGVEVDWGWRTRDLFVNLAKYDVYLPVTELKYLNSEQA